MPPKRISYSADYKLESAKYAAGYGNRAAEINLERLLHFAFLGECDLYSGAAYSPENVV